MNQYEDDFGFSFESEEPTKKAKLDVAKAATISTEEKYKLKLEEVEKLILPLLYNLMKNPEKAYIKWENRTEVIEKQIEKILAITRSD
jgi:hypothetical protein